MRALTNTNQPNPFWIFTIRWKQIFRASAFGIGRNIPIAFGTLSVFFAVLIYAITQYQPDIWFFIGWIICYLFVAAIFIIIISWQALKSIPPHDYAQIAVGGLKVTDTLMILSYEVWKVCKEVAYFKHLRFFNDRLIENFLKERKIKRIEELKDTDWEALRQRLLNNKKKIERSLQKINRKRLNQDRKLQRILSIKKLAASQFGIPERRLCDRILQYSPSMHWEVFRKYVVNWEQILDYIDHEIKEERKQARIMALYKANHRIIWSFERRLEYQSQMLRYSDLLPYVHGFASEHSTSSSLKSYARAISKVAKEADPGNYFDLNDPEISSCIDGIEFLFFKQRAHPGFDLNQLCLKLCQKRNAAFKNKKASATTTDEEEEKMAECQVNILNRLSTFLNDGNSDRPLFRKGKFLLELKSMRMLAEIIDQEIEKYRDGIIENYVRAFNAFFTGHQGPRFILTHGYSKTVREVLKRGLWRIYKDLKKKSIDNTDGGSREKEENELKEEKIPKIFIIKSEGEDEIDTRIMEYELKEDNNYLPLNDISVGNEELFLQLIKKHTKIMVLLGAECFDDDFNVIHPRGMTKRLDKIRKNFENHQDNCQVFVLAESYKCQPGLLDNRNFYLNHLDRIDVYEPRLIDKIITEEAILIK